MRIQKLFVIFLVIVLSVMMYAEEVIAKNGMVASAHELASMAGVEILKKGGNAVDAAVATALALNVVEPNASGIGGGGFMTIYNAKTKEVIVLDYREVAPASAKKDMFASEQSKKERWSVLGGKAVAVPGWLLGMWTALKDYGTMSFAEVAEPAIKLAEEGFVVHPMQTQIITDNYDKMVMYNDPKDVPFLEDGLPIEPGRILKQPQLAETFRLIAKYGPEIFYNGEIGQAIVTAVNKAGGQMTIDDLRNYKVEIRKPVMGTYRGYKIYSVPPASSGGTHIIQLLNILENFPMRYLGHNSVISLHIMVEAMKLVYADRAKYMADTAFTYVPLKGLTSKDYAKELAKKIGLFPATQVSPGDPKKYEPNDSCEYTGGLGAETMSTSSFSVVDQDGNIVASTNTINYFFGSGVFVAKYGIMLNNQMDDFSQDPNSVNAPEPGKRPLSSMAPTVILDPQDRPFMAVGAAGATRIITALVQIIMNVIDYGMKMDEAIEQVRIYQLATGNLNYEKGMPSFVIEGLKELGHKVNELEKSGTFGTAQGILFDPSQGIMYGGADSRRLGVAVGF